MGNKKNSYEEVKNFIEVGSNSGCKLLSKEYIKNTEKLNIICKCGDIFHRSYAEFKKGNYYCKKCIKNSRNKVFNQKLIKEAGDDYFFLEEYKGNDTKIKVKHKICNNEYYVTPDKFFQGQRCPQCARNQLLPNEEFLKRVEGLYGNKYIVLNRYNGLKSNIKVKDNESGVVYETKAEYFLKGIGCIFTKRYRKTQKKFIQENPNVKLQKKFIQEIHNVKLQNNNKRKTTEEFKTQIFNLVGNEYSILGNYINTDTKIKIKHNTCGYEWDIVPHSFIKGRRCPKCQHRSYKKTTDEFKKEVFNTVGDEYTVLGEYIHKDKKILIKHNDCGNIYEVSPHNFLRGRRCPQCTHKDSNGQKQIRKWLNLHLIKYKEQFYFQDCKYIGYLQFDFTVLDKNGYPLLIIEYDGQQHFKPIGHWGGEEGLKLNQLRDQIKNIYCQENNIPLLRIPYWDFDNIESILHNGFIKLGLLHNEISVSA